MSGSSYTLSDENDLIVNWNVTLINTNLINIYCNGTYVDIQLTQLNCNTTECTETVSGLPISNFTYTFKTKLKACAKYKYTIIEKLTEGDEEEPATLEGVVDANEQFQKITMTINQTVDQITSLQVEWSYDEYPLCQRKFKIEVREASVLIKDFSTEKINETINDLEPCGTYEITVYPISSDKFHIEFGDTQTYTMNVAVPSGIQNLTVSNKSEEKFMDVTWLPPKEASKCIKNYVVTVQSNVKNQTIESTSGKVTVVDVFACTTYVVKVYATTLISDMQGAEIPKEIRIGSRGLLN